MLELAIYALLVAFIFSKMYSSLGRVDSIRCVDNNVASRRGDSALGDSRPSELYVSDQKLLRSLSVDESAFARCDGVMRNIVASESSFSLREFVDAVESVFCLVLESFAAGRSSDVANLVTHEKFLSMRSSMDKIVDRGDMLALTVVKVEVLKVLDVVVSDGQASITVLFISEQIRGISKVSELDDGSTEGGVEKTVGSDGTIERLLDSWTFVKKLGSGGVRWLLDKTEAADKSFGYLLGASQQQGCVSRDNKLSRW